MRLNKGKERKKPDTGGTQTLRHQVESTSLNHETTIFPLLWFLNDAMYGSWYVHSALCNNNDYYLQMSCVSYQCHSCTAANDVTRQKDLSKFHRHLLNRLDHGTVEEEHGPVQPTESQRRSSREKDGSSYQGREKERERRSQSDHERQRERRRSGEERERRRSRHRSGGSVSEEERNAAAQWTVDYEGDREKVRQPEQEEAERGEDEEEEKVEEQKLNIEEEEEALAPKLPSELTQEDKEERRKAAAAKRTDSQAQLSAKERYLARKRARTSAPKVVKDD